MKDKDSKKKFLLNKKMRELMLNDDFDGFNEKNEEQEESESKTLKNVTTTLTIIKKKQPQITDFFVEK